MSKEDKNSETHPIWAEKGETGCGLFGMDVGQHTREQGKSSAAQPLLQVRAIGRNSKSPPLRKFY